MKCRKTYNDKPVNISTSDWMTKCHKLFKPIMSRSNVEPKQMWMTFDTQVKTALVMQCNIVCPYVHFSLSDRQTDRQTDRHRQTDRQTQTGRQTDRQIYRQKDRLKVYSTRSNTCTSNLILMSLIHQAAMVSFWTKDITGSYWCSMLLHPWQRHVQDYQSLLHDSVVILLSAFDF